MENLCGQSGASFDLEYKKKLSLELEKIKADLDTCVDCWDESVVYAGKSSRVVEEPKPDGEQLKNLIIALIHIPIIPSDYRLVQIFLNVFLLLKYFLVKTYMKINS